jgi:hypothetical protein
MCALVLLRSLDCRNICPDVRRCVDCQSKEDKGEEAEEGRRGAGSSQQTKYSAFHGLIVGAVVQMASASPVLLWTEK